MSLTHNLVINIYSLLFMIIIYRHSLNRDDNKSLQYRLYMTMLQITALLLVLDVFSRFDGRPETIYPILNYWGNCMMFLLNPILSSLWLLYVHFQIFQDEEKTRRLFNPLIAVIAIHGVMVVLTQFFGWFYYIDSDNVYHRGPLFLFSVSITIGLILVAFILITVNRKKIEKKYYFSLAFFAFPPFVGTILQIAFYGISLVLNFVVLSLFIVFLNIQNHSMNTDYLTGVNNRKNLEAFLKKKVKASTEDKTFSAILIDLNNFKSINDTFGHYMGDNALQITSKLLASCLRSNDFIARFGGDEFYIVLDISDKKDLEALVGRINGCFENYNKSVNQPYKLGLSMGYAVYDYHSHMSVEDFQKQIDILMYKDKQSNKEGK